MPGDRLFDYLLLSDARETRRAGLMPGDRVNSVGFDRYDVHAATGFIKQDVAGDKRKQRVVFSHTNVTAWMPFGSALTGEDVSGDDSFAAELLDAQTL